MRCCCCAVDIRIGGGAHKLNNMGFLYRNSLFEIRKAVCEFLRKILYLGFQKRFIQRTVDAFPESIERERERRARVRSVHENGLRICGWNKRR